MSTIYPPYVIERSSRGERTYDIFSRLLMDRIVFLGTPVTDDVANIIIAQLLFLDADNPERDITSTSTRPAEACRRASRSTTRCRFLRAPVNTTCMGMAASMGCFLLAGGRKGRRAALPHARVMMHQPSGGTQGTASDIQIQAKEILYSCARKCTSSCRSTRGDRSSRSSATSTGTITCRPREAMAYGIIDKVVTQDPIATRPGDSVELSKV